MPLKDAADRTTLPRKIITFILFLALMIELALGFPLQKELALEKRH